MTVHRHADSHDGNLVHTNSNRQNKKNPNPTDATTKPINETAITMTSYPSSAVAVFDLLGLLENVLSFSEVPDLLVASEVNKRWKEAARMDSHWRGACQRYWKRNGMVLASVTTLMDENNDPNGDGSHKNDSNNDGNNISNDNGNGNDGDENPNNNLALFWRPLLHNDVIDRMSADQLRPILSHPFLRPGLADREEMLADEDADSLEGQQEQQQQQQDINNPKLSIECLQLQVRRRCQGVYDTYWRHGLFVPFFHDIWFGSYASSVIDRTKRRFMVNEELCSPFGFDMYFKIADDEVWDPTDAEELLPYENGVMLYHHSVAYFLPDQTFALEQMGPGSHYQPTNLEFEWNRNLVRIGPYPYLTISKTRHGKWKLENVHVVMMLRDTKFVSEHNDSDDEDSTDGLH